MKVIRYKLMNNDDRSYCNGLLDQNDLEYREQFWSYQKKTINYYQMMDIYYITTSMNSALIVLTYIRDCLAEIPQ